MKCTETYDLRLFLQFHDENKSKSVPFQQTVQASSCRLSSFRQNSSVRNAIDLVTC
jgi:hypothetical protein